MASATKLTKQVPVQTTTFKTVEDGVSLRLTQAEALTLAEIFARIGGSTDTTARGYVGDMSKALYAAGVRPSGEAGLTNKSSDAIYFLAGSKARIAELAGEQPKELYAELQNECNAKQAVAGQEAGHPVGMNSALGAGYGGPVQAPSPYDPFRYKAPRAG